MKYYTLFSSLFDSFRANVHGIPVTNFGYIYLLPAVSQLGISVSITITWTKISLFDLLRIKYSQLPQGYALFIWNNDEINV